MPLLRITNGFDKLNDADLEAKANHIYASMNGNTIFPTPTPTLTVFQTAIDDYSDALAKAESGSAYDKAAKNQKRLELIDILHQLGAYVLFASGGLELNAISSGFSIAKNPTPSPAVTPAGNQKLVEGPNAGQLKYSFDKVPGARSYVYEYTPDPITGASTWKSQGGTTRKTVFTGLESGKRYWCRVMAIGKGGQGVYSEPVSKIVQ